MTEEAIILIIARYCVEEDKHHRLDEPGYLNNYVESLSPEHHAIVIEFVGMRLAVAAFEDES